MKRVLNLECLFATVVFAVAVPIADSAELAKAISQSENEPSALRAAISTMTEESLEQQYYHFARIAHVQELLGRRKMNQTKAHLKTADSKRLEKFVHDHALKRLRGKWKPQAAKVARTILEESRKHQFDPLFLIAVIENESSFNPDARGTSGEIGLMQILPSSAPWIAAKVGQSYSGPTTLADLCQNIKLGAAYLDYLRKRFQWNGALYLAAYNMGTTNVVRHIQRDSIPRVYPERVMKRYLNLYAALTH